MCRLIVTMMSWIFMILLMGPFICSEALETIEENLESYCLGSLCENIQYPDLDQQVTFFSDGSDETLLQTRTLVFNNSRFGNFPKGLFQLLYLSELDLRNCSINHFEKQDLKGAQWLKLLLLAYNELKEISDSSFKEASNLQLLFLENNKIQRLYPGSFNGLNELFFLNLEYNQIDELPPKIFDPLPKLRDLNLMGNQIKVLDSNLFLNNYNLQLILLNDNRLEMIGVSTFMYITNLLYLDLSGNADLNKVILQVSSDTIKITDSTLKILSIFGSVKNIYLKNNHLDMKEMMIEDAGSLRFLSFENNSLTTLDSLRNYKNLEFLDLSDNPKLDLLPFDKELSSLQSLTLRNCNLSYFPINLIANSLNLLSLDISHNKIKEINPLHFQYMNKLKVFKIHENPWNCYNLITLLNQFIIPNKIIYIKDHFDEKFVGEYKHGIACMYRIDDESSQETDILNKIFPHLKQEETSKRMDYERLIEKDLPSPDEYNSDEIESTTMVDTEEYIKNLSLDDLQKEFYRQKEEIAKLSSEIQDLKASLKIVASFHDEKFDQVFQNLKDLKSRYDEFNQANQTFWENVVIQV